MTRDNLTKLGGILNSLTDLEDNIARNSVCVNANTKIKQKDWVDVLHWANSEINEIYRSEEKNY